MLQEINEIIDFIKELKMTKEIETIYEKINLLLNYILEGDYKSAFNYALFVNNTTDYEGLCAVRRDMTLVGSNPTNNPDQITPEQHILNTLYALIKLALKKITEYFRDKFIEKNIEIQWGENVETIYKVIKLVLDNKE